MAVSKIKTSAKKTSSPEEQATEKKTATISVGKKAAAPGTKITPAKKAVAKKAPAKKKAAAKKAPKKKAVAKKKVTESAATTEAKAQEAKVHFIKAVELGDRDAVTFGLLGAIYMATDYVTSPMTVKGMLIYGVGIGVVTVLIRVFGAYPEGVQFAILIFNGFTPLLNKYIKPKRFGKEVAHV